MTLQTIADALGVSRTTVSNAYNRPDQLAPALREKVLETAMGLGYAGPDPAARRLRSGLRGAIGLMFSERLSYAFTDPGAVAFLQGLTEATEAKGYELLLLPGMRGEHREVVSVRDAVVGAFCLYCMPDDHPAVQAAHDRRLPVVIVDEPRSPGAFFVGIDDRDGARLVAAHVAGLGHEHVAIVVDRLVDDMGEGLVGPERRRAERLQGQPRAGRRLPRRARRRGAGADLRGAGELPRVRRARGARAARAASRGRPRSSARPTCWRSA